MPRLEQVDEFGVVCDADQPREYPPFDNLGGVKFSDPVREWTCPPFCNATLRCATDVCRQHFWNKLHHAFYFPSVHALENVVVVLLPRQLGGSGSC